MCSFTTSAGVLRSMSSHARPAYYKVEFVDGKAKVIFAWHDGAGRYTQIVSTQAEIAFRGIAGACTDNYWELTEIIQWLDAGKELVQNCNGAYMTPDQLEEELEQLYS